MARATAVAVDNGDFVIEYEDGTVSRHSPEDLAARLRSTNTSLIEIELDASQLEAVAARATDAGQTVDAFIESAIMQKVLRNR